MLPSDSFLQTQNVSLARPTELNCGDLDSHIPNIFILERRSHRKVVDGDEPEVV